MRKRKLNKSQLSIGFLNPEGEEERVAALLRNISSNFELKNSDIWTNCNTKKGALEEAKEGTVFFYIQESEKMYLASNDKLMKDEIAKEKLRVVTFDEAEKLFSSSEDYSLF